MRKIATLTAFAIITPFTTLLVFSIAIIGLNPQYSKAIFEPIQQKYNLFKSFPESNDRYSHLTITQSKDARVILVKKFLSRYNSPLADFSDYIVQQADKHHVDYRLIPSIAMQESTGCKFIPENSYNCWGYGIYGDKVLRFANYEEGIERVTRGLKKDYYDKGLNTPDKIMHKYTPPSIALGGPWASGVKYFFDQIEEAR